MTGPVRRTVGIITGLQREARALGYRRDAGGNGTTLRYGWSAADPSIAASACRQLLDDGAQILISAGLAGGLGPDTRAGDVCIADRIVTETGKHRDCDRELVARLRGACTPLSPKDGPLAGIGRILFHPEEKAALFNKTGAVAADMESHVAAEIAADAGIPFAAIRVISDGPDQALPPFVAASVNSDGTTALGPILRGLVREPRYVGTLVRLGSDYRRAVRRLGRIGACIASLGG